MKWIECPLLISPHALQQIEKYARFSADVEVCGLLYAEAFIPLKNMSTSQRHSFQADPFELADVLASRGEPLAIFHTHPDGDPVASESDQQQFFYVQSTMLVGAFRKGRLHLKSYRFKK